MKDVIEIASSNNNGLFVISLDFEMLYGLNNLPNQELQKQNVLGGRKAIGKILENFRNYNIHATWATVGMIMASDKTELLNYLPVKKPHYPKTNYNMDLIGNDEHSDPYHFGCSLINDILKVPYQEIGSHTFSHYFCLKEGQSILEFEADLASAFKMAEDKGLKLSSLVLPRNQIQEDYLKIAGDYGIRSYRGTEKAIVYRPQENESLLKRAFRLADAYLNLFGMNCYTLEELSYVNDVLNIPASRFLRPYMPKLACLEKLKISRIKHQMLYAAKKGMIFHLWWHPHNFSKNMEENLKNLKNILDYYTELQEKYGFSSVNMLEIAEMKESITQ